MNTYLRNLVLVILLLIIQYQIWQSKNGSKLYYDLKNKLELLQKNSLTLKEKNEELKQDIDEKSRDELLEEQAREEYNYKYHDEIFISKNKEQA